MVGVAGNGITAVAHYQTGGLWNHDVIALNSDGVNTINLSQTLNFTTGSSPLSDSRFAITFHEPETITVGDNAVIESVEIIPEPATLGLVAIFGGGVLFFRRRSTIR